MDSIGYLSPFVPPEWIAAHGLRPVWLTLNRTTAGAHDSSRRGMCACAGALLTSAIRGVTPRALVLTTACDQMRYAAAYLETTGEISVFLFNVPSTWQGRGPRRLYQEELERLGRFLVRNGGCQLARRQLELMIEQYDDRRTTALQLRPKMSARCWAETLVGLRSGLASGETGSGDQRTTGDGIPLALVGGPLLAEDGPLLELVENAGGRIVVDASEGGERTLPVPVDRGRLKDDPLDELARIYFDTIGDVFRRPNTRLYEWLGERLPAHSVRGIIFRRYPFCDLWHAELHRLRRWSDVPVLDIDVVAEDQGELPRTLGRIEAFLEMIR